MLRDLSVKHICDMLKSMESNPEKKQNRFLFEKEKEWSKLKGK